MPDVGRQRPSMRLMVVVFPAPFGPTSATASPGRMLGNVEGMTQTGFHLDASGLHVRRAYLRLALGAEDSLHCTAAGAWDGVARSSGHPIRTPRCPGHDMFGALNRDIFA